jgi:hypothetical protein
MSVQAETLRHPDPVSERVRWQITEGELLRAIGRGRGVNRSAETPLDIHLWTDVPLPELGPVQMVVWDEITGDLDDEMIAVSRQVQTVTNPSRYSLKGECSGLTLVAYRRDVPRRGPPGHWCVLPFCPACGPGLSRGLDASLLSRPFPPTTLPTERRMIADPLGVLLLTSTRWLEKDCLWLERHPRRT